jgi:hypothetical protein
VDTGDSDADLARQSAVGSDAELLLQSSNDLWTNHAGILLIRLLPLIGDAAQEV